MRVAEPSYLEASQMMVRPVVPFDPDKYGVLLEDCELLLWAREAGAKYLVTDVEALWLLAQALDLDAPLMQIHEDNRAGRQLSSDGGQSEWGRYGRRAGSQHVEPANREFSAIAAGIAVLPTSVNATTTAN
jgi:hypothetical protein